MPPDPHATGPVPSAGPSLDEAAGAIILVHGRGASAQGMFALYEQLEIPNLSAIAPQAAGGTWYPHSFLAPLEANQPYLDSALRKIESIVGDLLQAGISANRIALLGFSQGACLVSESVARHPRRYGAVIAFTGGLIGPPGTPREYPGSLDGAPVFLGTSDPDAHVPFERVQETQSVLAGMGAKVALRRYAGMGHTINSDELGAARMLLQQMTSPSDKK